MWCFFDVNLLSELLELRLFDTTESKNLEMLFRRLHSAQIFYTKLRQLHIMRWSIILQ